ncbi:RNase A-like domain-containing protein [Janibacter sp. G368]|uniref:RNase A-like domain-containing protein n=1 Tax=Janibacter sp. G368 TaxID=3420441 RepID=UPI003D055D3B
MSGAWRRGETGRHVPKKSDDVSEVSGSKVVIVKDPNMPKGYRILTSHPTPWRGCTCHWRRSTPRCGT